MATAAPAPRSGGSGQQSILREYLVALGFRVNSNEERRVNTTVLNMDRKIVALGKGAVSAATAVAAVTTALAKSWERMFYSARYADTTVEKMQSLEFGARNVGLEAGKMSQTIKGFAAAIRSNPGLQGLLESLGIQVTGRDKGDVLLDFAEAMSKLPPYIAERYAALFGMDPETLFNLTHGLEELKKAAALRRQMAEEAGLDAEKAAQVGHEYMKMWRETEARAGIFAQTLMIAVMPAVQSLVGETNELVKKWTQIVNDIKTAGTKDFWQRIREGMTGKAEGGGVELSEDAKRRLGMAEKELPNRGVKAPRFLDISSPQEAMAWWDQYQKWRHQNAAKRAGRPDPYAPRVATDEAAVDATQDLEAFKRGGKGGFLPGMKFSEDSAYAKWRRSLEGNSGSAADLFSRLEMKYGLPRGLLDRIWAAESGRGKYMLSPAGAKGHMGFMPETAREYGIAGREDDLEASADAAARKMRGLLRMYDGDARQAAAAYNWGEGNLSKYHLGEKPMPKETREYMDKVGGPVTITQDVDIHVHGSRDPHETAQAVGAAQQQVGASIVRNFSPRVR